MKRKMVVLILFIVVYYMNFIAMSNKPFSDLVQIMQHDSCYLVKAWNQNVNMCCSMIIINIK